MKKNVLVLLSLSLSVIFFTGTWLYLQEYTSAQQPVKMASKHLRYVIELKNLSNQSITSPEVALFVPLNTASQKLDKFSVNHAFKLSEENGINLSHVAFESIAPFANKHIAVDATVSIYPTTVIQPGITDLSDGELLQLNDSRITALSAELKQQITSPQAYASNISQWLLENIQYSGYIQEDRGAIYAISQRKGDCTEYMFLMMALLRANNIPTKAWAGFYMTNDKSIVKAKDYHNWVEYHDGEQWQVLDPLNGVHELSRGQYIKFKAINGDVSKISSQRFIKNDRRLAVSMR